MWPQESGFLSLCEESRCLVIYLARFSPQGERRWQGRGSYSVKKTSSQWLLGGQYCPYRIIALSNHKPWTFLSSSWCIGVYSGISFISHYIFILIQGALYRYCKGILLVVCCRSLPCEQPIRICEQPVCLSHNDRLLRLMMMISPEMLLNIKVFFPFAILNDTWCLSIHAYIIYYIQEDI